MKSIWTNSTFLKILSIVLAIAAWFYIIIVQNPVVEQSFKGIPVVPSNNELLLSKGLVVVDAYKMKVNVTARSNRRAISLMDNSSFYASLDTEGINQPGTYTLPINVTVNDNTVDIINKKPYYLDILVDNYIETYMDLEIVTSGELRQGYTMRQVTVSPTKVLLKGPQSIVNQVKRVVLPLNLENVSESSTQDVKYQLLDEKGDEIADENIVKVVDTVSVTLDIVPFKTVPFKADLTSPAGGPAYSIQNVAIRPESIRVIVPDGSLDAVESIYLGSFEVDPTANSITVPVSMPEGVEEVDQFTTVNIEYELTPVDQTNSP